MKRIKRKIKFQKIKKHDNFATNNCQNKITSIFLIKLLPIKSLKFKNFLSYIFVLLTAKIRLYFKFVKLYLNAGRIRIKV